MAHLLPVFLLGRSFLDYILPVGQKQLLRKLISHELKVKREQSSIHYKLPRKFNVLINKAFFICS
jgi:hypothetical protein